MKHTPATVQLRKVLLEKHDGWRRERVWSRSQRFKNETLMTISKSSSSVLELFNLKLRAEFNSPHISPGPPSRCEVQLADWLSNRPL